MPIDADEGLKFFSLTKSGRFDILDLQLCTPPLHNKAPDFRLFLPTFHRRQHHAIANFPTGSSIYRQSQQVPSLQEAFNKCCYRFPLATIYLRLPGVLTYNHDCFNISAASPFLATLQFKFWDYKFLVTPIPMLSFQYPILLACHRPATWNTLS